MKTITKQNDGFSGTLTDEVRIRMNDAFEIFRTFFNQKYGKSLVVKGNPGSGKTTFSLELAAKLVDSQPIHYLSSRFTDEPLKENFDFIDQISYRMKQRESEGKKDLKYVSTESLKKLEGIIEETNMKKDNDFSGGLVFDITEVIPEINEIYNFVEKNIDRSPLIILDSIEALAEKYHIDSTLIFSVFQNDLVEKSGAGLVVVLESTGNERLEYYSDGVVSLNNRIVQNYLVRKLRIEKLRGISIGSLPIYSYTLLNGRFTIFDSLNLDYPRRKIGMPGVAEIPPNKVPLGGEEIGKLLQRGGNAVDLGSIVLFHRNTISDRTEMAVDLLKNSLVRTTIADGRGAMDVSSSSYETLKVLMSTTEPDYLTHYITAEKTKRTNQFIINLEGKSMISDFPMEVIEFFMASSKRPNVYIFSTDFLNFTYGENFIGELLSLINELRVTGIIVIIADDNYYSKLSHYAYLTIHFMDVEGCIYLNTGSDDHFVIETKIDDNGWTDYKLTKTV